MKPEMIGTPVAISYDSTGSKYPGVIRVSFSDGHVLKYSAIETTTPRLFHMKPEIGPGYLPKHEKR